MRRNHLIRFGGVEVLELNSLKDLLKSSGSRLVPIDDLTHEFYGLKALVRGLG